MQVVLQLSRDCNFACTYCYQSHRPGRGMSADTVRKAVRFALDEGHEHVALTYFGGEPLLERGVIEETLPGLARIGAARGALVTAKVSTNGDLIDESFCELARRHAMFVSLSTDGCPEAQDAGRPTKDGRRSSEAIAHALEVLSATRTPFATYSVVHPRTAHLLAESVDWLFSRGSRILISTLDFGAPWTDAALLELGRQYRALSRRYMRWSKRGLEFYLAPFDAKISAWTQAEAIRPAQCAAGVRQVAVDPDGYLYPCIEFLENDSMRVGHVDTGFDRDAMRAWRHDHAGERPDECGGCGIRERCGSTCACLNLRTAGSARAVSDLLCAHERLVTLAADRIGETLWAKKDRGFLRRQYEPRHHVLSAVEHLLEEAKLT